MAEKRHPISRRAGLIALAAVAGMLAGSIAVYVRLSGEGNPRSPRRLRGCAGGGKRPSPSPRHPRLPAATRRTGSTASFKAPDGTETTLAAFAGKATLVNLLGDWCVPCRAEMPALDRLEAAAATPSRSSRSTSTRRRGRPAFLTRSGEASPSIPTRRPACSGRSRAAARFGLPTTPSSSTAGLPDRRGRGPAEWDSEEAKALIEAATKPAAPGADPQAARSSASRSPPASSAGRSLRAVVVDETRSRRRPWPRRARRRRRRGIEGRVGMGGGDAARRGAEVR